METDRIIHAVAKAMYVSINFTNVTLQNMSLTNLSDGWPNCEYVNWNLLPLEEKNVFVKNAREWLTLLKNSKPEHYQILVNNWESIDSIDP